MKIEHLIRRLFFTKKGYTHLFYELYHDRWPVEEDYKTMKCRIGMEAFTGQSVLSVYQDFHAGIFAKNLVSMLTFPVQTVLRSSGPKEKYVHQVNFAQVLGKSKHLIVLIFQRSDRTAKLIIEEFTDLIFR